MVAEEEAGKMRVLLVQPRDLAMAYTPKRPVMGLAILAAVLEKEGMDVKIMDMRLKDYSTINCFKDTLKRFKPNVVGFTVAPLTTENVYMLAKIVKEKTSAMTIAGGPEVSILPEQILSNRCIDFVIHGEADYSLPQFITNHFRKTSWKGIYGLGYKKNGKLIINPRKDVEDLDKIPFPAWDYFPLKKYNKDVSKIKFPIITSKGCPYRCTYCVASSTMGRYRVRSAKSVADEIEHLKKKYGVATFQIEDDNFALDKNRISEICSEIIKRKLNVRWSISEGFVASHADYKLFKKMKEAGCYLIAIGVETTDKEILKNVKKPVSLEQIKYAFKSAKKAGLITKGFFICGLPGATYKKEMEYIRFFKEVDMDIPRFGTIMVYPKTELYDWVKKNAHLLYEDIDSLHNQLSETTGDTSNLKFMKPVYETPEFSKEERKKAFYICNEEANKWALQKLLGKQLGFLAWCLSKIRPIRKVGERILDYSNKI